MTEDQLQKAVVRALAVNARSDAIYWHTPNGGSRNAIEAAKLKGMGTRAGIPDILILCNSQLYGLELKTERGRLSPLQRLMLDELRRAGARVAVSYGLDDALEKIGGWGLWRKPIELVA